MLQQSMEECQNTALTPLFFDTVTTKYGKVSKYDADSAVLWNCYTKVWKSVKIRRSLRCSLTLLFQSMEECQNTALTQLFFDTVPSKYGKVSTYGAHSAVLWHCYTKVWKSIKIRRSLRCSLTILYQRIEECQNTALTPLFFDTVTQKYGRVSKYGAHSAALWQCYTKIRKRVKIRRWLQPHYMFYAEKKKKKKTSQSHHQTFRLNKFSALYTQKPVRWKTDPWVYCPAGF